MKNRPSLALVALVGAAALVVVLGLRVRALNRENDEIFRRLTGPYAGMYVPAFVSRTLDGAALPVGGRPRTPQVLFVFTTTCPYCEASIPAWSRIGRAALAAHGPGAAVGLSLDGGDSTRAYVRAHGLPYPVAGFPDHRTSALYRTRTVPVTLVVDTAGRVTLARVGALRGAAVDSVLAAAGLAGAGS